MPHLYILTLAKFLFKNRSQLNNMENTVFVSSAEVKADQSPALNPVSSTAEPDAKSQPWKQYLLELEKEYDAQRGDYPDKDLFRVSDGFNDHGLAG